MLDSKGPYADVYALLDGIKDELIAEQSAQRQVYDDQKKDCDDEITLREGEIKEAEDANKAAEAQFNACTGGLASAELALGVTEETLRNKQSMLQKETALRASQVIVFEHEEEELEKLIANLVTAL